MIIHKRKKSFQDLDDGNPIYNTKIENNYNYYSQNNKKNYSLDKNSSSPFGKTNKYALKTIRLNSPQSKNEFTTRYSSNTYHQFHSSSNSQRNTEENKRTRNDVNIPRIKPSLSNQQYNLTDINKTNKNSDKPYSYYNNLKSIQNNIRNIPTSINLSIDTNNKYLLSDSLSNQRYNNRQNHQTKTSKFSKTKVLQKDRSQERLQKRLYINSVTPKRNNNSIIYSDNYKNLPNDEIKGNNYNLNNHQFYQSSDIKINRRNSNSTGSKSTNKDKEKKKERIEYKTIAINNNNNSNNDYKDDKYEEDSNNNSFINLKQMDINPVDIGQKKPPISLCPEIFSSYHSKFKPSKYSSDNEFTPSDFIKAYAYNSNEGNIRDYNEDTITATRIYLEPKDRNNYFYFFGVYDGHGGDGCSIYLKNYLHKNIKEMSTKGIKAAIDETEKNFIENIAVVNGKLYDMSGSCAVMALIKQRKCIIANIGDSRCVLYKNKRVVYSTRDHKPNAIFEKRRIEAAGGSIYKTQSVIELYQNGKLIEIPWRVLPGGLSVSRTFGDIESKVLKYGGKKDVVAALPDIVEFELTDDYNFMVIGCDGIFDVLSNNEILQCIQIVLKINKNKNKKMNELCGDFAQMIIKSALAKESFDNVSCIVVLFNINGLI